MNITPPFGYGPIVPMRKETLVRNVEVPPEYALKANLLPLGLSELSLAMHDYPVMFVRIGQTDQYALVGILGLEDKENLFTDGERLWEAGVYVPAYVRRYPYCMTRVPANGDQPPNLMVCIEEKQTGAGQVMFDSKGEPTARWNEIMRFINEYEADLERLKEVCSLLADLKLLEATTLRATIDGRQLTVEGLYRVNEQGLDRLNANEMKALLRKGALAATYLHLASMNRFSQLIDRKQRLSQANAGAAAATEAPAANA